MARATALTLRERLNPYVKDEYRIMFDEGWWDREHRGGRPRWPNSKPYMRGWTACERGY
jgi:hypothetical protein